MLLYIVCAIAAIVIYFKYFKQTAEDYEILSKYYGDKFWCKGSEVVDTAIRPFKVDIPDSGIEDLLKRIDSTRYPTPPLRKSRFLYGVNSKFMREFVEYWRNSYSWRDQEKEINKYNHFKTKIEGLDIHFVHIKPKSSSLCRPCPIMLCHGWPGSFYNFYKLVPMLTDPTAHGGNETDVFEVIIPSIPGYGFSQPAQLQGFNSLHCARIFHKLMLRLGHKEYYLQGGDWGSIISTHMSMLYPSAVKGVHLNMLATSPTFLQYVKLFVGSLAPRLFFDAVEAKKLFPLRKVAKMFATEMGYAHIQGTKPDTVGFALSDSPVGLAAYILEKFSSWTDIAGREEKDGGLLSHWTKDELLNNIMIYWWSGNVASTMRLYKEAFMDVRITQSIKIRVPLGCAWFPKELTIFSMLKSVVESKCTRLISFTRMKDGGHFAAFQVPTLLVEDLRQFVRLIERVKTKEERAESEYTKEFHQTHLDRFEVN